MFGGENLLLYLCTIFYKHEFMSKDKSNILPTLHKTDYSNYKSLNHFVQQYKIAQEIINEANQFYRSFLTSQLISFEDVMRDIVAYKHISCFFTWNDISQCVGKNLQVLKGYSMAYDIQTSINHYIPEEKVEYIPIDHSFRLSHSLVEDMSWGYKFYPKEMMDEIERIHDSKTAEIDKWLSDKRYIQQIKERWDELHLCEDVISTKLNFIDYGYEMECSDDFQHICSHILSNGLYDRGRHEDNELKTKYIPIIPLPMRDWLCAFVEHSYGFHTFSKNYSEETISIVEMEASDELSKIENGSDVQNRRYRDDNPHLIAITKYISNRLADLFTKYDVSYDGWLLVEGIDCLNDYSVLRELLENEYSVDNIYDFIDMKKLSAMVANKLSELHGEIVQLLKHYRLYDKFVYNWSGLMGFIDEHNFLHWYCSEEQFENVEFVLSDDESALMCKMENGYLKDDSLLVFDILSNRIINYSIKEILNGGQMKAYNHISTWDVESDFRHKVI